MARVYEGFVPKEVKKYDKGAAVASCVERSKFAGRRR
jgi:hypothetical protein